MADTKVCLIEGCGKPTHGRGYCKKHYKRLLCNGDPLTTKRRVEPNHCGKNNYCPAAKKMFAHINYVKNINSYKERTKARQLTEAYKQNKKTYNAREDVKSMFRSYSRKWRLENPEQSRQSILRFREKNKEKNKSVTNSYAAKRRARKRHAMPSWLTPDHISQINAVYAEAKRLEKETGIAYHVDHIVPLAGKIVCGLHVPWNLRAIPGDKNLRRPRIYSMDMD